MAGFFRRSRLHSQRSDPMIDGGHGGRLLEPGQIVDRYRVLARIGEGGMAEVYQVRHVHLQTLHALKVHTSVKRSIKVRFEREGRIQASIAHPNVVRVSDVIDLGERTGLVMDFIKIEHTLFALPFAYLGAFLAQGGMIPPRTFLLIATAFTGLRTAAMSLNRIIDREIDAMNPRTAGRHIPAGLISLREAYAIVIASLAVYFVSAYLINETAFYLSPIPVITAYIYPYLKRYTVLSHYVLGLNLAFAPMGGWIAVTNRFDPLGQDLLPFLIGVAVMFWVAGFDMIYALQDYEFDRKHGLHSFPAKYGIGASRTMAFVNHTVFFAILSYAMLVMYQAGLLARIGLAVIFLLIVAEHLVVRYGKNEKSIQIAFFYMNAALSSALLIFTFLDVFL